MSEIISMSESNKIEFLGHSFIRHNTYYTTTTNTESGSIYLNLYTCEICNTYCLIHKHIFNTFYIQENFAYVLLKLSCQETQIKKLLE